MKQSSKSFGMGAQRQSFASLRFFPPVAGQLRREHRGHTMYAIRSLALLAALFSSEAFGQTTFDLVVKGTSCSEQKSRPMDCDYKIGKDFWLSISAVGSGEAGITFMKSDFNGKYYGTVAVSHGCVVVKTGAAHKSSQPIDLAFVSPKNGKVYQDWPSCQAAK